MINTSFSIVKPQKCILSSLYKFCDIDIFSVIFWGDISLNFKMKSIFPDMFQIFSMEQKALVNYWETFMCIIIISIN